MNEENIHRFQVLDLNNFLWLQQGNKTMKLDTNMTNFSDEDLIRTFLYAKFIKNITKK